MYKETKHWFHAIMSPIFLPWVLIWISCYLSNKSHNEKFGYRDRVY